MRARDLMQKQVVTVTETSTAAEVLDVLQQAHIHGVPVVDAGGALVGFVSQEDLLFAGLGTGTAEDATLARDLMTSPAVTANEDARIEDVCRLMWQLRIHHVPVVRDGNITGILSSLDLCHAVAERRLGER